MSPFYKYKNGKKYFPHYGHHEENFNFSILFKINLPLQVFSERPSQK